MDHISKCTINCHYTHSQHYTTITTILQIFHHPKQKHSNHSAVALFFPHPSYMEVPRFGVKLELQLPAYATARVTWDLSRICELHHRSWQHDLWARPGIEPALLGWVLVGFISAEPQRERLESVSTTLKRNLSAPKSWSCGIIRNSCSQSMNFI